GRRSGGRRARVGRGHRARLRQTGGLVGRAPDDVTRPAHGAGDGRIDQGPQARRGYNGGDAAAAALSRREAGGSDVTRIADWRLRIADWKYTLRIRNPKSAIRNCLLVALAAARDPTLLGGLGVPDGTTSAEGYLFPTTYLLPQHIGARELVRVMTHQFIEQWSPEWQARLDSLRMTRHQLVTLASIVESEVRYDPDRPFIAAVYKNRLERGMRLEADPTVSYAYGRRLSR